MTEDESRQVNEEDVVFHDSVPGYLVGGGMTDADVEQVQVEMTPVRPQPGAKAPTSSGSVNGAASFSSGASVDGSVLDEDAAAAAAADETAV